MDEKKGLTKILFNYGIEIAIVFACVVYLSLGFVGIIKKEASIEELIANCAIVFIFGITINQLFAKKGIWAGQKDANFLATKKLLCETVEKIMPDVDKLEEFLEEVNKKELRTKQEHLLLLIPETYSNYVSGKIDYSKLDKRSKKLYNKVSQVKIKRLTAKDVTSEIDTGTRGGNALGKSKKAFNKEQTISDVIRRIIPMLLFGYFTVKQLEDLSWVGFIWSLVQVVFFLASGMLKYWKCYNFITDDFRNRLIVKNNILEEFYIRIQNADKGNQEIKNCI